jgi:iron complex outermembrane receptor protein
MLPLLNKIFLYLITPLKRSYDKWVLTLLLLISHTVCLAQNGILHGKVKDGEADLQGASISLGNFNTVTDRSGEFSIPIAPGTYTLIITYAGFANLEQHVTLHAAETLSLQFGLIRKEVLGEVVVLSSRLNIPRSNLYTTAPVELITSKDLRQTGQQSLIQMLNFASPAFHTSRQNLYEPVALRGMAPDHSLILINGNRYHNSAYINSGVVRGVLGKGSVVNDLNSIPFSAIEKIEILRDGATSQYGSDAIAGVINIELKRTSRKTNVNWQLGQHHKGDGQNLDFGIHHGIPLGKKTIPPGLVGFLNFSGDLRIREATHRGGLYNGTVYTTDKTLDDSIIRARGFNRKNTVSNDGVIPLTGFGGLINGRYIFSNTIELTWTGTASYRHVYWPGIYRFPKNTSTVNTLLHPDGFKAVAILNSWDITGIVGIKGKMKNGWHWKWNSIYGKNTNKQLAENSNNASQKTTLGAMAPTSFFGGKVVYVQQTHAVYFSRDLSKNIRRTRSANIGIGAEYRFEKFYNLQGDEASWKNFDTSGNTQGGAPGTGGIQPANLVNVNRGVISFYVDMESEINDRLLFNLSGRFENYNDFGANLAGKLSMRYKISSLVTVRSSVSNGYHAPALQQIYSSSSGNAWRTTGGNRIQVQLGHFRNNSHIAKAFGVKPLKPEKALNLGSGFTSSFSPHLHLTVDGYWIQVKDRIVLSGRFDKANNTDVKRILERYSDVDQVQFMTNAINTRSHGIDMTLACKWQIRKADLRITVAANLNRTRLYGGIQTTDSLSDNVQNTNTLFNREEWVKIEKSQPASKLILTGNYTVGKIGMLVRGTRFGKTAFAFGIEDETRDEFFSAKILTDLSITYLAKKWISVTAGANNIFNIYPDPLKNYSNTTEGILVYSNEASPFGFNGGYYFINLGINF